MLDFSSSAAKATARSLRSAEQQVVMDELGTFEATHLHAATMLAKTCAGSRSALSDSTETPPSLTPPTATASQMSVKAAAASSVQPARADQTQRLMQVPFTGSAVHGERTALDEAYQVHNAVAWLRECPSGTLRQLQQRVLCASEALFTQLVGMPATARELLELSADPNEETHGQTSDEADGHVAHVFVTPPPPLTFSEFLSRFLRDTTTTSPVSFYTVLLSGRPQPAAPLSSLHLVYGLHVVEDLLRPPPSEPTTAAATTAAAGAASGLEAHQALLSEVVHWAHFFEQIFDEAREGLCRDPINFYVAVLLACAERGAWELHNTPDAVAEEAVRRLNLDDGTSGRRPRNCGACEAEATQLAQRCRTYVRQTLRAIQLSDDAGDASSAPQRKAKTKKSGAGRSRFFLATPAVVWWAAAFLRLYRLRSPVAAPMLTTAAAAAAVNQAQMLAGSEPPTGKPNSDIVSSAEAYFVRDWIMQAAKMDEDGFAAQEKDGAFTIPLSCATAAPVAVFRFTQENVQTALRRISERVDASVASNTPLPVQELLSFLQDDFAVVPYYMSFFAPD